VPRGQFYVSGSDNNKELAEISKNDRAFDPPA
jgi:hypothetical protein